MKKTHKILAAIGAAAIAGLTATHGLSTPMQNCHGATLQDSRCTPGAVLTTDTKKICVPGYTTTVRNVPQSEKDAVLKEYGYTKNPGEIDHLISLELGGSNDIKNLWPEAGSIPNPKDHVENQLHADVCSGKITIQKAQKCISTDWTKCY